LLSGVFLDKINKVSCVLWSLAALVVGYLLLASAGSEGLFYAVACILGLSWGVVMPLLNAIMFDVSSPSLRGRNLNLSMVLVQGSFFMGPFVGGLVLSDAGYAMLFYLCAGLSVVTMIMTKCISSGPADDGDAGDR
jgi:MFS family permease